MRTRRAVLIHYTAVGPFQIDNSPADESTGPQQQVGSLLLVVLEVHVVPAQKAGQLALQGRRQVVVFSLHLLQWPVSQKEKIPRNQNKRRAGRKYHGSEPTTGRRAIPRRGVGMIRWASRGHTTGHHLLGLTVYDPSPVLVANYLYFDSFVSAYGTAVLKGSRHTAGSTQNVRRARGQNKREDQCNTTGLSISYDRPEHVIRPVRRDGGVEHIDILYYIKKDG